MQSPAPQETVVAIDGTALLFRAYYGAPAVHDTFGLPVGAVIGALRAIADLVARARGSRFVVVFDAAQRTFRNDIFPAYKANRGDPPEDLVPQFDRIVKAVDALGLTTSRLVGYEADDLMATLARLAREQGLRTWLVSPDKDLFQLVDDREPAVQIYDRAAKAVIGSDAVRAKMGVAPCHATTFQALVGDSSDNVPGVRGVGPKAATALVSAFGGLDAIYAHLEQVPTLEVRGAKALSVKLSEGRDDAYMAMRLVTLCDTVPMELGRPVAQWALWSGPRPEADAFFSELGTLGPLNRLRRAAEQRRQASST